MDVKRMWHLIAEMVSTYAEEGDLDKAMETLTKSLSMAPTWIPNALFDERTLCLRHRRDFQEATLLPPDDAPAHFNAAHVALEYDEPEWAYEFLAKTFRLAQQDGTAAFLREALQEDEIFTPYLREPKFVALLAKYSAEVRSQKSEARSQKEN